MLPIQQFAFLVGHGHAHDMIHSIDVRTYVNFSVSDITTMTDPFEWAVGAIFNHSQVIFSRKTGTSSPNFPSPDLSLSVTLNKSTKHFRSLGLILIKKLTVITWL